MVKLSSQFFLESAFCRFNGDFVSRAILNAIGFECALPLLYGNISVDLSVNGHPFVDAGNIVVLPPFSTGVQVRAIAIVGTPNKIMLTGTNFYSNF